MKSHSRLTFWTQGAKFNPTPLVVFYAFMGVLYFFFYYPPSAPLPRAESLFGYYVGQINIAGISLSHGWAALPVVFLLPTFGLLLGTPRNWIVFHVITATILVLSDYPVDMNSVYLMANLVGVGISMTIGSFAAALLAATLRKA